MNKKNITTEFTWLDSQITASEVGHAVWKEDGSILHLNDMPVFAQGKGESGKPGQGYLNSQRGVSTFSADGKRKGRQLGFSPTGGDVPLAVFQSTVSRESVAADAADDVKKAVRKRNAIALLQSVAPHLEIKVGASPARKETVKLSKAEILEAAKKAGHKTIDAITDYMMDDKNRTREIDIPAIEPQTVRLADLASKNPAGKIKLSPAEITEALTEFGRVFRDSVRQVTEED